MPKIEAKLTEQQKELLKIWFVQGAKTKDLAKIFNLSIGRVNVLVKPLRSLIKEDDFKLEQTRKDVLSLESLIASGIQVDEHSKLHGLKTGRYWKIPDKNSSFKEELICRFCHEPISRYWSVLKRHVIAIHPEEWTHIEDYIWKGLEPHEIQHEVLLGYMD